MEILSTWANENIEILFFLVVSGLYGLFIGSFLNVVIYRVPNKESLNTTSKCPSCDKPIKKHHLIPVLSWLLLKGKCSNCKNKISARYPIIESFTSVLFMLFTWYGITFYEENTLPLALIIIALLLTVASLTALSMIDLDIRKLPRSIIYTTWLLVAPLLTAASFFSGDWGALLTAVICSVVMGGIYFTIWFIKPNGMGFGDVRLGFLIGFVAGYLGISVAVVSFFWAFLLGAIIGLSLIALKKAKRKTALPFGPFMCGGFMLSVLTASFISDIYLGMAGL